MTATGPLPHPRPIDHGPASMTPPYVGADRRSPGTRPGLRVWARRSFAERRLGSRLDRDLHTFATVLHHRQPVSRPGSIDHVVVAPTGVWVIAAVHDATSIERRRRRGTPDPRSMRIAGESRPDLFERIAGDVTDVEDAIEPIGFGWVDVHAVLCLTKVDKGVRSLPFQVDDVAISWPKALIGDIGRRGSLSPREVTTLATQLSVQFPTVTP